MTQEESAIYNNDTMSGNVFSLDDEKLIQLSRSGDEFASDVLIDRYTSTVRYLARPYFLAGGDAEDLVQEGMIGLIKAMRSYNTDEKTSFKTYAATCIKSKLHSALKASLRKKHGPLNQYISIEAPFFDSNPEKVISAESLLGIADDPAEYVIGNEALEELSQLLDGILSDFEAKTLSLYLEGRTYQEISKITAKPQKSVDNAVQRIRKKLVNKLSEKGESRQ